MQTEPTTEARLGDWIQTYTGKIFYPIDPRPWEISLEDIAHSLSLLCRFTGHTREFYSVAEHSVRVSWLCPDEHAAWGLMHDASEAYIADLTRPIKRFSDLGEPYLRIETRLMHCICQRFGLPSEQPECVSKADLVLLMTEKRDLCEGHNSKPWEDTEDSLTEVIEPWPHRIAEQRFLQRAKALGIK